MRLYHYSHKGWIFDPNFDYSKLPNRTGWTKPSGLWLSDDDAGYGWANWCRAEEFRLEHLEVKKAFAVDMKRVLLLDDFVKINKFTWDYEKASPSGRIGMAFAIDWELVKKAYSGIIITPYCGAARFEFIWYSGWDCGSGCIWDLTQIREVVVQ